MFNKKKKHSNNNNRPHYTRQNGGPETPPDGSNPPQIAQPQENDNANPPINTDNQDNGTQVQPEPVITAQNPPQETVVQAPQSAPTPPAAIVQNGQLVQGQQGLQGPQNPQAPQAQSDVRTCQICNMPIRSLNTAVHHKTSGELVHFDCALRELSREFYPKLGRFKKIYYIGAGNFAVVKEFYDKRGHLKNYEIVEKIPYEPKEK